MFTELQSGSTLLLGVHSKLIRSRTLQFGKKDATVLPTRTFPIIGPLGAAPARLGWTATVLRFQMLLVPDVRQSNAATNFQFCLSPTMRLSRRHSIVLPRIDDLVVPRRALSEGLGARVCGRLEVAGESVAP